LILVAAAFYREILNTNADQLLERDDPLSELADGGAAVRA